MKKIVSVLLCILLSIVALAQSANMMSLARAELAKRGLTESEVRARLLQEGIDVDSIQPADYPSYQGRVIDILNRMQEEKNAKSANPADTLGAGTQAKPLPNKLWKRRWKITMSPPLPVMIFMATPCSPASRWTYSVPQTVPRPRIPMY